jgi:hypothetical protein
MEVDYTIMGVLSKIQVRIEKVSMSQLLTNRIILQIIYDIVSTSYVDSSSVMNREIEYCDQVYLAYDDQQNLCSFFMVGEDKLIFKDMTLPSFYMGLSATSIETKNTGIVRLLYQAFMHDISLMEKQIGQKVILWYTTVTPSVFYSINQIFVNNEPMVDGSYSEKGKEIALAIQNKKGWKINSDGHPFVLKGVAHNTLYSKHEAERINKICREKNFTLFNDLEIDESKGDRLLRIAYVPSVI